MQYKLTSLVVVVLISFGCNRSTYSKASDGVVTSKPEYISFTLENTTSKSIPLIIPNVMNPNLSPYSESGVKLQIGQKILFRQNGKKHVLLIVDKTIKDNSILNIAELLAKRKREINPQ